MKVLGTTILALSALCIAGTPDSRANEQKAGCILKEEVVPWVDQFVNRILQVQERETGIVTRRGVKEAFVAKVFEGLAHKYHIVAYPSQCPPGLTMQSPAL